MEGLKDLLSDIFSPPKVFSEDLRLTKSAFLWILSDIGDVQNIENPLNKVQAGLVSKSDAPVPLKCVHVRAQLQDLASQVRPAAAINFKLDQPLNYTTQSN